MARESRTDLQTSDFLIIRSQLDDSILKIVTPQNFEVGFDDDEFKRVVLVHGSVQSTLGVFSPHFSGSLTTLLDGTPYLKGGTNVQITTGSDGSVTINSSLTGTPGFLAAGDALAFAGGGNYDTSASKVINLDIQGLDPHTAIGTDKIVVRTAEGNTERTTLTEVLAIGTSVVAAYPIHFGSGIEDSSVGAATSWDNSAAVTLAIKLSKTNQSLEFDSGQMRVRVDGSTVNRGSSGLSVLRVPAAITNGTGVGGFSYDGSSPATVAIDDAVVPTLTGNNTWAGKNSFGVSTAAGLTGSLQEVSSGIPYLVGGSNVTITTSSIGQITINSAIGSGYALSSGNGLSIPGGYDGSAARTAVAVGNATKGIAVSTSGIELDASSLPTSGDRNSYFFLSDGSTTPSQQQVGTIIDTVDRTAIMAEKVNGGIQIDFYGTSNPAQFSLDLDGSTLSVGASGVSVASVPNSLSQTTGIATFSFDGSSAQTVGIDTSIVPRKNVVNTFTGVNNFSAGLAGSLTHLVDGRTYIREGVNIAVSTGSDGSITISSVAGGGGIADGSAQYLVLQATGSLTDERVFTAGSGLATNDAGAGNAYTVEIDLASNPGLQFTAGQLDTKLDPNGTITKSANGLSVAHLLNANALTDGVGITDFTFDGSSAGVQIEIDNSVVATLTGSQFSGNVGITGSFGVQSSAIFNTGLSGSLQMLSDGTTRYLVGGTGINVSTGSSGQVTVAVDAPQGVSNVSQAGGSTYSNVTSMIFTGSLVTEPSAGTTQITPVIGAPEDGSYSDGLFTDFSYGTSIGTAVDRFNEVLKGLAPAAAPSLDDMDCADSGATARLSFGSSQSISGYVNARPSILAPASGLSDTNINGVYDSDTASNDLQVACFTGTTVINGTLNADVTADGANYSAYSFGNADQGTLKLYVNDNATPVHSVDLSTFGSGNSLTAGSGFNLVAKTPGHFSDGSNFETFQHRQGTYTIAAGVTPSDAQRLGWNWARVVHTVGGVDTTCNYVEWVNDNTNNGTYPLSSAGASFGTLSMTGTEYLSGVKYYTGGSATYSVTVDNAYRNVYSNDSITFNGTNCGNETQAFDPIDWSGGEDESKQMSLSQLMTINASSILNGSISTSVTVLHPLRADLLSVSSQSHNNILLYSRVDNSTDTYESFRGESKRVKSGSYVDQAAVISGGNEWNSTTALTTVDGLMFYDQKLVGPDEGANGSDFSSIANGPAGNVDYSGITSGLRTFYRWFRNPAVGSDRTGFDLEINGSGTIVTQPTTLTGNRIHVLCKLPTGTAGTTGWMDLAIGFSTGQTSDGDGCYSGAFDSSLSATNTVTFGTQTVAAGEYVMVKIEADASWTGNISSMTVTWS